MKQTITLTESDLHSIIKECVFTIFESVDETNLIKTLTDDDWAKINPNQMNLDLGDFTKLKDMDDNNNSKMKELFGSSYEAVNTGHSLFGDIKPGHTDASSETFKDKLSKIKDPINQNIQQKHFDATGRHNLTHDDFDTERISKYLEGAGLELHVNGKTFAYGNQKLPEDIMIVNLTATFSCPSAENGDCAYRDNGCYSNNGETMSPSLLQKNMRNEVAFKYMTTREILKLLELYIECAPTRIHYIRISEDGDFKDQETVDFCDKIAGHLKKKYGIQTAAYTHRTLDFTNVKNMVINMSDYRRTNGNGEVHGPIGGDRYFFARTPSEWAKVPEGLDLEKGTFKCHCDCRKCRFCYQTKEENGEPADKLIKVIELWRKKGDNTKSYPNKLKSNKEVVKQQKKEKKNTKKIAEDKIHIIVKETLDNYYNKK